MLGTFLTIAALAIILLTFLLLVSPIRSFLLAYVDSSNFEFLETVALIGCKWAEQWLKTSVGQEKKEAVMDYLIGVCAKKGLPFDEEDMDKAIESAVYKIKGDPNNEKRMET